MAQCLCLKNCTTSSGTYKSHSPQEQRQFTKAITL